VGKRAKTKGTRTGKTSESQSQEVGGCAPTKAGPYYLKKVRMPGDPSGDGGPPCPEIVHFHRVQYRTMAEKLIGLFNDKFSGQAEFTYEPASLMDQKERLLLDGALDRLDDEVNVAVFRWTKDWLECDNIPPGLNPYDPPLYDEENPLSPESLNHQAKKWETEFLSTVDKSEVLTAEEWMYVRRKRLVLLANAYCTMVESFATSCADTVDAGLNQTYLDVVKQIRGLLASPEYSDFPGEFDPVAENLFPSSKLEGWEKRVRPAVLDFLGRVQAHLNDAPPVGEERQEVMSELLRPYQETKRVASERAADCRANEVQGRRENEEEWSVPMSLADMGRRLGICDRRTLKPYLERRGLRQLNPPKGQKWQVRLDGMSKSDREKLTPRRK